jgi:hypothetical protein
MSELLKSVKADLTDRRLLPIVALVIVVLAAAVGYAVLGGSGSSASPTAGASAPAPGAHGIAVTESQPSSSQAIAETTDGSKSQRKGSSRDPFAAIGGAAKPAKAASAAHTTSSASSAASHSATAGAGAAGGSSSSAGATSKTTPPSSSGSGNPTPSTPKPSKPKTIYSVALQFGQVPAGTPAANAELKPYADLVKATPLPSAKERLLEYVGVTVSHAGTSAAFAVDAEVILHGGASCLPSPTQCQVIDLKQGASEQLEYITPQGALATYELRVVNISSNKANAATVRNAQRAQAQIAPGLLGDGGALHAAGLRFAKRVGVLVFGAN